MTFWFLVSCPGQQKNYVCKELGKTYEPKSKATATTKAEKNTSSQAQDGLLESSPNLLLRPISKPRPSEWSLSLEIMCMHFILSGPLTSFHIFDHIHYKHCQRHYGPRSWLLWPVILVWKVWFSMLGRLSLIWFGLVWQILFDRFGLVGLVW